MSNRRILTTKVVFAVVLFSLIAITLGVARGLTQPDKSFSCGEMKTTTAQNVPGMTPAQFKALSPRQQEERTTLENNLRLMYAPSSNGTEADCPPPAADFGPDGAVTFGSNAGVSSPAGKPNPGIK